MAKELFIPRKFGAETLSIINDANDFIQQYRDMGITITMRALYYRFIGDDKFPDTWMDAEYNAKNGLDPTTKNTIKNYKRLCSIIADARDAGRVDWAAISDSGRVQVDNSHWENPADLLDDAASGFGMDLWAGQERFVVVMVEKDAVASVIQPVCTELDVTFCANRGYTSASTIYRIGKRLQGVFLGRGKLDDYYWAGEDRVSWTRENRALSLVTQCWAKGEDLCDIIGTDFFNPRYEVEGANILWLTISDLCAQWYAASKSTRKSERDKADGLLSKISDVAMPYIRAMMKPHPDDGRELNIIYVGDFDPSGQDMTRDVKERLELYSRCPVVVHRVALNFDQIQQYNLPENPAKLSDPRATEYIKKYGEKSWELDALQPNVLQDIVREKIEELRDADMWQERYDKQEEYRTELEALAQKYKDDNR